MARWEGRGKSYKALRYVPCHPRHTHISIATNLTVEQSRNTGERRTNIYRSSAADFTGMVEEDAKDAGWSLERDGSYLAVDLIGLTVRLASQYHLLRRPR